MSPALCRPSLRSRCPAAFSGFSAAQDGGAAAAGDAHGHLSVTAVTGGALLNADIQAVKAAADSPSAFITEFTARAVSNPFRGMGGSPANPGVATVIDGVPQLKRYSST